MQSESSLVAVLVLPILARLVHSSTSGCLLDWPMLDIAMKDVDRDFWTFYLVDILTFSGELRTQDQQGWSFDDPRVCAADKGLARRWLPS